MKRLLLRGTVLGLILWTVGVMPVAWADATITVDRASGAEARGTITINVEASSPSGLSWVRFEILKGTAAVAGSDLRSPPEEDGDWACCGTGSTQNPYPYTYSWDTTSLTPYNGNYTFRVTTKEQFRSNPHCPTADDPSRYNCRDITVKVNNPPSAPEWIDVTGDKVGGRPVATVSWRYSGSEPDLREFQIQRSGPDGMNTASISAGNPGAQGCSKSGGTYTCSDNVFPSSGYGGNYSYRIMALRSSTVGPSRCGLAGGGYGAGSPCVGATTSSSQSVSFTEPTTPTGGGGGGTGGNKTTGGKGTTGGSGGFRPAPGGQTIVGGTRRERLAGDDGAEFFQGSYDPTLPYQNKYMLVPDKQPGKKRGNRLEAIGATDSTPLGIPLRDRSVLIPVAGGLLLFLGAAHVRRLLSDR